MENGFPTETQRTGGVTNIGAVKMGNGWPTSEMLTQSCQNLRTASQNCEPVALVGWYRWNRMGDSHPDRHRLYLLRSKLGDCPSRSISNLASAVERGVDVCLEWAQTEVAFEDRLALSFVKRWWPNRLKGHFGWPSGSRNECQRSFGSHTNARTAAIFACKDGGIGVDPELRLRRPVTPFGILDGTGMGGGLEIVESA